MTSPPGRKELKSPKRRTWIIVSGALKESDDDQLRATLSLTFQQESLGDMSLLSGSGARTKEGVCVIRRINAIMNASRWRQPLTNYPAVTVWLVGQLTSRTAAVQLTSVLIRQSMYPTGALKRNTNNWGQDRSLNRCNKTNSITDKIHGKGTTLTATRSSIFYRWLHRESNSWANVIRDDVASRPNNLFGHLCHWIVTLTLSSSIAPFCWRTETRSTQ